MEDSNDTRLHELVEYFDRTWCARLSGRRTNGVNVRTNNDVEGNANVVVTMLFTALISSILPSSAMVDAWFPRYFCLSEYATAPPFQTICTSGG